MADQAVIAGMQADRFPELAAFCGRTEQAGVLDLDEWRDWDAQGTTPDQRRIEDYLDRCGVRGTRILHVGVGNSRLALRFHRRAGQIVGTTISPLELDRGRALGLANYTVMLQNKHDVGAAGDGSRFDFIVDNNPTTFCCCLTHLMTMLDSYAAAVGERGQVVTDRRGLGWTSANPESHPRWRFDFDDLRYVAAAAGLGAYRIDRDTYVLSRAPPPPLGLAGRLRQARLWLRRAVGRLMGRRRRPNRRGTGQE